MCRHTDTLVCEPMHKGMHIHTHTRGPEITLNPHLLLIIADEGTFLWHSGDLSSTGPLQPG